MCEHLKLGVATVVNGSESPAGDGITGAQRCVIRLTDGTMHSAVLKRGTPGQITAECFCGVLLRAWNLDIPDPYLVLNGGTIAFAGADVAYPSLKQRLGELLRTATLLYSSLAQMDLFDSEDDSIAPQAEEVTKRFSTEVRNLVIQRHPELTSGFGRGGSLIPNGPTVKFGFLSSRALIHFSVLNAIRQTASVKDARAKLWELARASDVSGIKNAALIAANPRHDDPTLGPKQLENLLANRLEMEREADAADMRLLAVTSVNDAADKVIAMACA